MPLDVVREGDGITVHASLPGVDPEHIDVSVEDSVLTIAAATHSEIENKQGEYLMKERRSGSFHRALRLPDTVDADLIKPVYKNGRTDHHDTQGGVQEGAQAPGGLGVARPADRGGTRVPRYYPSRDASQGASLFRATQRLPRVDNPQSQA